MSSRSRPVTGIVLLEEVTESGKKKEGVTISAELVLDGGVAATATFEAAPGYDLHCGMFSNPNPSPDPNPDPNPRGAHGRRRVLGP